MTVQITIVGLGQVGASAGLALAEHKSLLHRVGHDKDPGIAKQAQKMGAVDDVKFNLPSAVREAKIVLLSLPAHEMRSTMEIIAPDLPEGAVVLDTPGQRSGCAVGTGNFTGRSILRWVGASRQSSAPAS